MFNDPTGAKFERTLTSSGQSFVALFEHWYETGIENAMEGKYTAYNPGNIPDDGGGGGGQVGNGFFGSGWGYGDLQNTYFNNGGNDGEVTGVMPTVTIGATRQSDGSLSFGDANWDWNGGRMGSDGWSAVQSYANIGIMNDPSSVYHMGHSALLVGGDKDGMGWTVIYKVGRQGGNIITGGPSKPKYFKHFNTLDGVLSDEKLSRYNRIAFFKLPAHKVDLAIAEMSAQADSYYSVFYNNCGHAISNTFEAIGLNGANTSGTPANDPYGYATPNYMYLYMMQHNKTFIQEIIRK